MQTTTFSAEISFFRYLNPDGSAGSDLPGFATDTEALIPLYQAMVLTKSNATRTKCCNGQNGMPACLTRLQSLWRGSGSSGP